MKLTFILLLFSIWQLNLIFSQVDSIFISDYQKDCIEITTEKYTIEKDRSEVVYRNDNHELIIINDSTTNFNIVEYLFLSNKISIESIYKIIKDCYEPREDEPLFLYGLSDLSNQIIDTQKVKYRLIELLIGSGSGNAVGMHLLLYDINAKNTDELKDFIKNSQLICFKYIYLQI